MSKLRFLIISDESIGRPKKSLHTHFDIIPANNIDDALDLIRSLRPKIKSIIYLSEKEVEEIYFAMKYKSENSILAKLEENTRGSNKSET